MPEAVAPSAVPAFGRTPRALTKREITTIQKQFANAALRAKKAGFDLVEFMPAQDVDGLGALTAHRIVATALGLACRQ